MARRGPDDSGVWHDPVEGIGFCHRRLSILDLTVAGHQPMFDSTNKVVISFNGEIYNYAALRAELIADGYVFNSHTDTEVLLNLYLKYGVSMLPRLNGMFAFAIWDKEKKLLFIARDAFGVKPLYFSKTSSGFIFASTLHAILCEQSVKLDLNTNAITDYLTLLYSPSPRTMLASVDKLEPGWALLIKGGKVSRQWCWQDLPIGAIKFSGTDIEAEEAMRQNLENATRRQMISDVPVGAFLSGGLDSSSIVAFARKYAPDQQLECFTIGYRDQLWAEEGIADDLPYARLVAKHLGVSLNVVEAGPEIIDSLTQMIFELDEPQADPAGLHVRAICRRAHEMGIKVLLSGTGGDDLFSGYRRHDALMKERYWSWIPNNVKRKLAYFARHMGVTSVSRRRISKAFRNASLGENARISSYFNWVDLPDGIELLSQATRAELMRQNQPSLLLDSIQGLPGSVSALSKMLYLEQKFFLVDHNLNYTDKMSMAESVEVRVPYLDPDLLNFSWSLPDSLKYRHGKAKWLLKKAMEPLLPHQAIYRPKTGFGAPLRRWIHVEMKDLIEYHLSDARIRARGIFDVAGVNRLRELDKRGQMDGAYTIFAILCIEIWCTLFLDGEWKSYAST
jgi:asparagine synthase (glutamine-hydrolysing)